MVRNAAAGLVGCTVLMAAPTEACRPCHAAVVESYGKTAMARSFYRLTPDRAIEAFGKTLAHPASQSTFTMTERAGRFFLERRHAAGYTLEKEIQYVLGSGNHARSYVHRTAEARLLAMPVSWYSLRGGFWEMAPGFDRADHPHFRRQITYECFFCHNAYPALPRAADGADPRYAEPLPEGIDCSRCHGPAEAHLAAPRAGSILNPGKLTRARQLEVCLQCHLETTSNPLPHALRRFGRGIFSYAPSEPLSAYMLHFDHAPGIGFDDKFEFVSAPYRLRKSACFRKSESMTCTSCHDPHRTSAGAEGVSQFREACLNCHGQAHHKTGDCASCHMPRRQPEDAPHTLVADHFIQRHASTAPGSAARPYRGEVVLYGEREPGDELYIAIAQVKEGADFTRGIPRLEQLLRRLRPRHAGFYLELAEALRKTNQNRRAALWYDEALRRDGRLLAAWRGLATVKFPEPGPVESGLEAIPGDAFLLPLLGEIRRRQGRLAEARAAFEEAIRADPGKPEPYVNLGVVHAMEGRKSEAADFFRRALAIDPDNAAARRNLEITTGGSNSALP